MGGRPTGEGVVVRECFGLGLHGDVDCTTERLGDGVTFADLTGLVPHCSCHGRQCLYCSEEMCLHVLHPPPPSTQSDHWVLGASVARVWYETKGRGAHAW
jgi:hypothetical protein